MKENTTEISEKLKPSHEVIVITGLGIGEETKSQAVEWFASQMKAHTVLRSGGSQCGHNIMTDDGREQEFSHFGAATFDGVHTHLKHMVVNPVDLFDEAIELEEKGVENPFDLLTIDENCLVVTPFHGAESRFREIMRGIEKKGTIGKGVGEAIADAKTHPELAIYARDFRDEETLKRKVEGIRQLKIQEARDLIQQKKYKELPEGALDELINLNNTDLVQQTVDSMIYTADLFRIVDDSYLDEILSKNGTIINEPSHGALLHPWYGFVPHVTQIDPTSQDVLGTLEKHGYNGKITRIGVSRCYMTRHGAGPLVSFNQEMTNTFVETHNAANPKANEWLGPFRSGNYDIVATKYALEISGEKDTFTGLMISYLDVLAKHDKWQVCEAYVYEGIADDLEDFFEMDGNKIISIKVYPNTKDTAHYNHQLRLTELLKNCRPILTTLEPNNDKNLEETFLNYIEEKIGLPVVAVAHGPRKSDRELRQKYST